ncbi:MAG: hypothetical protein ACI9O3_000906 [Colwellia sp.]|jgi:uncharacterized protein YehS (DUF1456 family)|uniref:DUF1456 family protein n=1 Tax=unclassified Colwellia TaxID=196834 RepID=UPI000877FFFD|nr:MULTISPECIES: DUF1456 family protein [unclassified Colwellia]MBA6363173.1 DUF1456 family protein [Colwellia sp. BRX8-8]AOW76084.1 hypothetical protein A3Q34_03990 [Colwellia sp. PAMC 20917]MBA6252644.1 DUF1456 family protein [Colwellia sp. MB3u-55]MBA6338076.1 DUF1456 family protein [Colwellia sp. BRX8-7]MBA6347287.1 DUF1456 family protein [Colwellia sp. BRX8-9]
MINNDILRRLSTLLDFDDEKTRAVFKLNACEISAEQLVCFYKEKDDETYVELLDVEFASFLNGLIVERRGAKEGPQAVPEAVLTNNAIFNKLKIAFSLQADEVIDTLELAELSLTKYELSAFFRSINNKHYRDCSDEVLSTFIKGLKIKLQG